MVEVCGNAMGRPGEPPIWPLRKGFRGCYGPARASVCEGMSAHYTVVGAVAGGGGMQYVITASHRLAPPGWRLEVGKNGRPLCGGLDGHMVCLVRRAHENPQ